MFRSVACRIVVSMGCVIFSPALVRAQAAPATSPAGSPATAPATHSAVAADPTTPQGTLTMLSKATESGDTRDVRGLLHTSGPDEQKLADTLMERTEVYARFRQAATKAFGPEAANQLTGNTAADAAESEARIAMADVKVDGDKAVVEMDGQPVNLVKVGGKWKLSLATLTEGMGQGDVDQKLQQIKMLSDVVSQTTNELNAGKFKTPDEVNEAIRARLATVMLQAAPAAATQPATAPSAP